MNVVCRSELISSVLRSLPRRDQRMRGEQYLHGLLTANGRKSIRNIAKHVEGRATEQSLHHFVSVSPWDWTPIRKQLADSLCSGQPGAWVLQSLPIPKKGDHSVGVERQLVPAPGQTRNGQRAFGLWYANEHMAAPVHWRLYLPETWVEDHGKRRQAEIPPHAEKESTDECAAMTLQESVYGWELSRCPTLLDARAPGLRRLVPRFTTAKIPFVGRISPEASLAVADDELRTHAREALPAWRILKSLKRRAAPVRLAEAVHDRTTALVASSRVWLAGARPDTRRGAEPGCTVRLVGVWYGRESRPASVWLTNIAATPDHLLRLFALPDRVSRDFSEVGDQVGLRDFEGRSFPGWHRHMTLASVAHTASVLGETAADGGLRGPARRLRGPPRPAPPRPAPRRRAATGRPWLVVPVTFVVAVYTGLGWRVALSGRGRGRGRGTGWDRGTRENSVPMFTYRDTL